MPRIPAAERRTALVEAALRVVATQGVGAATTRAIVAEAGMSLASFHYAFASRDELMHELIAFVVAHEQAAVLPAPDGDASLRDIIRAGLQRYADLLRADPLREQAMLELTQQALRSSGLAHLAKLQYDNYFALAAAALATAAEQTGSTWTRPVDEVARLLVVLTDGLTITWLVERDDAAAASIMDFAADALAGLGRQL
ncbi:TetR family transcriptional regulator [Microterricola gilva]|uniref:TetR family transcriptional regulator n=1 Tax=Microterricola gilva TaxID=393267 RepID=A0A4Q8AMW0_9MICO|nr:TetR family transcriptional regulator [Microterricola gilva]RZU65907.1 TetR family transcriptional regulator [Microterricola gilva]